jgi:deoxyribonuclease V
LKIARIPHSWSVSPKEAVRIQRKFAERIIRRGRPRRRRLVAGVDLAFMPGMDRSVAGVVVWDAKAGEVVEQHVVRSAVRFPYVPGLLSFREAPAILAVLRKLRVEPDVFMFDGQGLAHPRRFGLACHVGLLIDRPSLGCAKSVLVGTFVDPLTAKGSRTPIEHEGECVGLALRTRDHVKPVYVSVGHRMSLEAAVETTLSVCTRYRIPEPTRLADQLVAREKTRR